MITPSQILFSTPYSINKDYVWLQAQKFYNFSLMFITTLLDFLICGFHCYFFCLISYSTQSLLRLYFPDSSSFLPNPSKFPLVFNYTLVDSNPCEFLHYYYCALCNMATFHATKGLDLTIMVDESRTIVVSKHCLCAMFAFQPSFLLIYKDVSYDYNNFVSSSLY